MDAATRGVQVDPAKDAHLAGDVVDASPLVLVVVDALAGGAGIERLTDAEALALSKIVPVAMLSV